MSQRVRYRASIHDTHHQPSYVLAVGDALTNFPHRNAKRLMPDVFFVLVSDICF